MSLSKELRYNPYRMVNRWCDHVNTQNVRCYAPLKVSDLVNGGRPEHLVYTPKLMVFTLG